MKPAGRGRDSENLHALAAFLPKFESPGFEFGRVVAPPPGEDGVCQIPFSDFSPVASDFVDTCYKMGWVQQHFDWPTWKQSAEAVRLRDDPTALEQATPDQLRRLLTLLIRQDRFADGELGSAFEAGLLVRILQRIEALAASSPSGGLEFRGDEESQE